MVHWTDFVCFFLTCLCLTYILILLFLYITSHDIYILSPLIILIYIYIYIFIYHNNTNISIYVILISIYIYIHIIYIFIIHICIYVYMNMYIMLYNIYIYIMVLACNCPSYPPRMTQGRAEHRRRTPFHWHCDSTHAPLRLRDAGRRSSRGGRKKCFHGHRLGVQSFPLMKWDINEIKWNIYNGMIWNWYQWDM